MTNWAAPQRVPRTHSPHLRTRATSGPVARRRPSAVWKAVKWLALCGAVVLLALSGGPLP